MLIEMVDGGIKNITTDRESYGGCETCDWGSEYINEFNVELTGGYIEVKVSNMYEHALSEGYMMKLFITNIDEIKQMNEVQFFDWLQAKVESEVNADEIKFNTTLKGVNN